MMNLIIRGFEIGTFLYGIISQKREAQKFSEAKDEFLAITLSGIRLLLLWAILNIAIFAISLLFVSPGVFRYFCELSLAWNIITLAIGAFGMKYLEDALQSEKELSLFTIANEIFFFQKIVLLAVGLDVAYVIAGYFLYDRGMFTSMDSFQGYGLGILLQGMFLLFFDIVFSGVLHKRGNEILASISGE